MRGLKEGTFVGAQQSADTSGVPDCVAASLITQQPPMILDPADQTRSQGANDKRVA